MTSHVNKRHPVSEQPARVHHGRIQTKVNSNQSKTDSYILCTDGHMSAVKSVIWIQR